MSSKFISRISPSTTTTHSRTPQPTLLALQCSDNTIRLYQVDLIPKISSQSLPNDAKTLNEFLIPLRLLRDHTTGGQWPIRLSFRQGPLFHITTPQPAIKDNPVSVISDSSQAKPNIPLHPSNFHPTQKQIMRVRATDASGLVTSVSSGSLAATSGDEVSSTTLQRPPKPPSHVLSDDVSVNSDVSEILLQSSSTKTTRQKHLEDDGQETESLLSGKGAISADEGRDDDAGSVGSENGAADDSGDDEARLNMIAGLATSTLLTANNFESGLGTLQQSSKNSKNDDLDLLLGGSLRRKVNISQNYQRPIDWTSSFVLATGSNNGQVLVLLLLLLLMTLLTLSRSFSMISLPFLSL